MCNSKQFCLSTLQRIAATSHICQKVRGRVQVVILDLAHTQTFPSYFGEKKMAVCQGYECEFLDSVFDGLYCKKCTLVAKRLSVATCCMESFCHGCIVDTQEQGKPCPACGEKDYNILDHVKNQKRIKCLRVYCSVKERGCDWSGTLEQLDTHLDPDQDNCQYVDTECPLDCHMTIPKNKVEQHVAQHCAKRPYVCQHCNFKATYEEVVDKHLPECKYVPLMCPNLCGVTFERDFMEDHMKMCRLQEVGCEFSGVGCDGRFIREDQEEHTRQNSQKHLTLTASLAVETREDLQQKLLEQDKKHKEEEEKLRQKIEEQEKKLKEEEKKRQTHEEKLGEQEKRLGEQKEKLNGQEKKLEEEEKKWQQQEKKLGEQEKKQDEHKKKLVQQEKKLEEEEKKRQQQERKLGEQEKKQDEQKKKVVQQEKKLEEEEKKRQQQERKLGEQEKKLDDQNKVLKEQEKKLIDQENERMKEEQKLKQKIEELNAVQQQKLDKHKELLEQVNSKLQTLEQMLKELVDKSVQNEGKLSMIPSMIYLKRRFEMMNFSYEKAKDKFGDWKSPAMYTHVSGYKFCIGVDANARGIGRGNSIRVYLWSMSGEYDDQLKWPAKVTFTVELINQKGGGNVRHSTRLSWNKPTTKYNCAGCIHQSFLEHSKLNSFLSNDTLYFCVSEVELL